MNYQNIEFEPLKKRIIAPHRHILTNHSKLNFNIHNERYPSSDGLYNSTTTQHFPMTPRLCQLLFQDHTLPIFSRSILMQAQASKQRSLHTCTTVENKTQDSQTNSKYDEYLQNILSTQQVSQFRFCSPHKDQAMKPGRMRMRKQFLTRNQDAYQDMLKRFSNTNTKKEKFLTNGDNEKKFLSTQPFLQNWFSINNLQTNSCKQIVSYKHRSLKII